MKRSSINCEYCEFSEETEPIKFGTRHIWITVTKAASHSKDTITAGEHHFCCDKCLKDFMNKSE